MILIADSGSTKTDWRLWNPKNNEIFAFSTIGLNPYFVSSEKITSVIKSHISNDQLNQITNVFFYGSGCGSSESKKKLRKGILEASTQSEIEVHHDLLGAARAMFGNESGIACILGTGSNAGYYNGNRVEEEAISFGYILGDEGSGNHLGRLLLKSIYSKKAPINILQAFYKTYPELNLQSLLNNIYQLPLPNRFLAGFSFFIHKYKKDAFVRKIIFKSLNLFIDEFVLGLSRVSRNNIGFQGSIAYYFKDEITEVFNSRELKPSIFLKNPIDSLLSYHQQRP